MDFTSKGPKGQGVNDAGHGVPVECGIFGQIGTRKDRKSEMNNAIRQI